MCIEFRYSQYVRGDTIFSVETLTIDEVVNVAEKVNDYVVEVVNKSGEYSHQMSSVH